MALRWSLCLCAGGGGVAEEELQCCGGGADLARDMAPWTDRLLTVWCYLLDRLLTVWCCAADRLLQCQVCRQTSEHCSHGEMEAMIAGRQHAMTSVS